MNPADSPPTENSPASTEACPDRPGDTEPILPSEIDQSAGAEEARSVEEAATVAAAGGSPRAGRERERTFLFRVALLAVVLVLGWIGGTTIWQLRRDVVALENRLGALQERVRSSEAIQARAALLRARAELRALRETLPDPLARELAEADRILEDVARRQSESP